MPYFCLRVPTGGGKTWLAAKSVALANTHLLRVPHSVVLWLVPSKTIRDQTVRGLKDCQHPLNAALSEAGPLTVLETEALVQLVSTPLAKATIAGAAETSRCSFEFFRTPSEQGQTLLVPQLALIVQGELQLFDDPEVLDYPWALSTFDAKPTPDNLLALGAALKVAEGGVIDVDEASGKMMQSFLPNLQRDLGLAYTPEHWDAVKLAAWLCNNVAELIALETV